MISDGGKWLRKQSLLMARINYTPVDTWLDMPMLEFTQWIDASNELQKAKSG